jgi:hypothetical protein
MRKTIELLVSLLVVTSVMAAQETPRQEVYLGYDFLRANSATNVPAFSMNGGGGQYSLNVNSWLGFVADIYAVHNGNVFGGFTDPSTGIHYPGGKIDNTIAFYQFGPRVYVRHWSRMAPFFEMLLGAGSFHTSVPVKLSQPIEIPTPLSTNVCTTNPGVCNVLSVTNLRAQTSQTPFSYALGGGLDLKMSHRLSFRPIQADLQYTRLQNLRSLYDKSQYNFRYSTGFIFTFGSAQ